MKIKETTCHLLQSIFVGGRKCWKKPNVQLLMGKVLEWVERICYVIYRLG
jgi:hypothetical protein